MILIAESPSRRTEYRRYLGNAGLVLCTGNSARSLIGEALLNHLGGGRIKAHSAGSHPAGAPHPDALAVLKAHRVPAEALRSKHWEEFSVPGAPQMDVVLTVCDRAASAVCPVWPGASGGVPLGTARPVRRRPVAVAAPAGGVRGDLQGLGGPGAASRGAGIRRPSADGQKADASKPGVCLADVLHRNEPRSAAAAPAFQQVRFRDHKSDPDGVKY